MYRATRMENITQGIAEMRNLSMLSRPQFIKIWNQPKQCSAQQYLIQDKQKQSVKSESLPSKQRKHGKRKLC